MRIGILGGGQLARMLTLAGYPMGIHTLCIDPAKDVCATDVTKVVHANYGDQTQLKAFADQVDVITFETENIPLETAEFVSQLKPFYPSISALKICQDRLLEKNLFKELNIPTPQFAAINSLAELEQAVAQIKLPAVLKTRRFGYDGKGQAVLKQVSDLASAWEMLGGQALILEQFMRFDLELSLIAVREKNGNVQFYPLVENQHQHGILRLSMAPFADKTLQQLAEHYVQTILTKLNYVGTFVIELFQIGQQLFANEMAPRVHNSGHWTIEGASTSQFANHLRAISGLPLGSTAVQEYNAMFNIIGEEPDMQKILNIPAAHYHTYEKQAKPNRKLGHITITASDKIIYQQGLQQLKRLLDLN